MGFHDGQQKCAIFRLREAALFLFKRRTTPGRGTYNQPHVAMCDHKKKPRKKGWNFTAKYGPRFKK